MVGGSVEEYINRDTREVSQFEDKPQSEQTYLRDFEEGHKNIEEKMPSSSTTFITLECNFPFFN
jgi:hypothetical protein